MEVYPKISIITPNFNQGEYLERTILSVLNQNYPNLEYIIIDGGSTDNSIDIIKKHEPMLSYWISEPDKGLYWAIQKGLDRSSGEIMGWINSDDMYHPNSLFTAAEIFQSYSTVHWITGIPTIFDKHDRTIHVSAFRKWSKYNYLRGDFRWIQQESTLWRRTIWQKSGAKIDTRYRYAADLALWCSFFKVDHLYSTKALIGGFRVRPGEQLSSMHMDLYVNEAKEILKNWKQSEEESNALKKIARYAFLLRFLPFRKSDSFQARYQKLFQYSAALDVDDTRSKIILKT